MPFAPEYVRLVLGANFEDATRLFLSPLMAIHAAHLVMLAEQGIVSGDDARAIRDALEGIERRDLRGAVLDERDEDLFCYVNRSLAEGCGPAVAARLHTARSRNDIDMTMYRMRLREAVLDLLDASLEMRRVLVALAARHTGTLVAAHTHTQPAQPTTVAHYLLAVIEQLDRDGTRLQAAFAGVNRCPLGACAITGTGFPIDRELTSALLGFDGPTGNTYGSIAAVDHLLESVAAAAVAATGLGRVLQDLLTWSMVEFGYLRLADGFVQPSSIMPQKRNPVALEHARSIASRALGAATSVFLVLHNTPFGDVVDSEDDLQPLVASVFDDATRAMRLAAAALKSAELDEAALSKAANRWGITMTELADTLVREYGLPFQTAHAIVARFLRRLEGAPGDGLAQVLGECGLAEAGVRIEYREERLADILDPRHFVEIRRTPGGPSPVQTAAALSEARESLARAAAWLAARRAALQQARGGLEERRRAL